MVIAGEDLRVDVASARTEHYEYPAALPTVEHSSIRQDLHRRDFTINAMAVSLLPADFGVLLDSFGGAGDLSGASCGYCTTSADRGSDPHLQGDSLREPLPLLDGRAHAELARGCVGMGLVGDLSGARVRDELVAILSESEVSRALGRLDELGLARAVHPALDCGPRVVALVTRIDAVRARHTPELPAWRIRLAALSGAIPADELATWLERLRVRRRDARIVGAAAVIPPRLAGAFAGGRRARPDR